MRFNPSTDRAVNIDAIADQCRTAITTPAPLPSSSFGYAQAARSCWERQSRLGAGHELCNSRSVGEALDGWHAADVAEAMGDHVRARLIRQQVLHFS